ncbi:Hemolysin, contains CBS domains [Thermoactinomyces sp. DSM 45891]|uniref:hemolysin family protein n=1 Tax=Thermoactinomyces sp. DSM 45891 TaxID=1761907 RepID=UPI0009242478|nr:hemolysin family protein [Thermoactinomyces sp. DSM 45891]SFX45335.1 Hemolysin, contains CBS domains [Thermoactinomyces sp. DSM 45891]
MDSDLVSTFWNFGLVVFLVLLNGFFVASEFALVKVRSTRIAQLTEEGNFRALAAQKLIANLDAYLSATQLGITLASLGLGWVGEPFVAKLITPLIQYLHLPENVVHIISFAIGFSIITFLHIVIGEMAPKSLAIRQAERVTLVISRPLHWFFMLFRAPIWLLNSSANKLLQWLGVGIDAEHQAAHTEEEIRMLVEQSHKSGIIDQTELSLFDNIFEFADRVGREVMVPRINMICLYATDSIEENIDVAKKSQFTRFPLCGKDKDEILGVVHIRDLYECLIEGGTPDLIEIARPSVQVPETMEIKDILRTLQKNRTEMAIVIDEYGGTSGIVTLEDIIEEIVGEIQDEFDDERPFFQEKSSGTSIDARLLIEEVNEHFHIGIEDDNNDTIGGWVFSQLQALPKVGVSVHFLDFTFTVQEMDSRSITRLLVRKSDKSDIVQDHDDALLHM